MTRTNRPPISFWIQQRCCCNSTTTAQHHKYPQCGIKFAFSIPPSHWTSVRQHDCSRVVWASARTNNRDRMVLSNQRKVRKQSVQRSLIIVIILNFRNISECNIQTQSDFLADNDLDRRLPTNSNCYRVCNCWGRLKYWCYETRSNEYNSNIRAALLKIHWIAGGIWKSICSKPKHIQSKLLITKWSLD